MLNISLLGPFTATYQDQPIHKFKTIKVQALFIYLAVERDRPHRRESLMELLWPDMPLESAQVNLRQTVFRLRQTILDLDQGGSRSQIPIVVTDRLSVGINPEAAVYLDVEAFQSLAATDPAGAVDLYRGDFLSDFYLVDSSPFEAWAESYREQLRRKALDLLKELTTQAIDIGDTTIAQNYAWRQLEIDSLTENAYRQLMFALVQSGQRSAALAQFQICQRRLKDELGIDPSPETLAIYEQIQADVLQLTKAPFTKLKSGSIGHMPVFLLTDIESSTRLWDTYHHAMLPALLSHNAILEDRITKHGGRILELRGDGVKAVFERGNPLPCMIDIQKSLADADWGEIGDLKIRIGLHGVPTVRKGFDYFEKNDLYYGPVLNHTARIMDAGWGGQILVSEQVRNNFSLPEGASWQDFGLHRMKSLDNPIHIYGLTHPDLPVQSFPPLRTLEIKSEAIPTDLNQIQNNLPTLLTPLIGRQNEIITIKNLLGSPDIRLVTIVGHGGMGKTRLALATAESILGDCLIDRGGCSFPDGIFFVPLVSLNDSDQILTSVAKALNIPLETSQSSENLERSSENTSTIREKLLGLLATKQFFLILDNFEHLLDCRAVVSDILSAGSSIKILATSRERLHIHEEQIFPIEGLSYPDSETPQFSGDFTAMEMFIQSARRLRPDFDLKFEDIVYLTRICKLVGGMPLGLELAASWIDMMSLKDIAIEIQAGLDFLETNVRNVPDRHRSIRAVFESSLGRLSQDEKRIFSRLSIFRGEFSRYAAQKVAQATFRNLATFVNKSLLKFDQDSDRYQIHELLRQCGAEILDAQEDDFTEAFHRYSAFFCDEIKEHTLNYLSGQPYMAIDRIEKDFSNIVAAWDWAVSHFDIHSLYKALDGICFFFDWKWQIEEGMSLCKVVLEKVLDFGTVEALNFQTDPDSILVNRLHAKILTWLGRFNIYFRHDLAVHHLEKAMGIVDRLTELDIDVMNEKVQILFNLGAVDYLSGDLGIAKTRFEKVLLLGRKTSFQWAVLKSLTLLGDVAIKSGMPREAKNWYVQCLAESRTLGNHWEELRALQNLGWAARSMMSYDEAKDYYTKCLALSESQGNRWEMFIAIQSLGFLALFLGELDTAHERFTQSVHKFKQLGLSFRMLPSQVHIGITQWLMGEFELAEDAMIKALNIAREFNPVTRRFPIMGYAEFLVLMGRYGEANDQISILETLGRDIFMDHFSQGRLTRILGLSALANRDYQEAEIQFNQSILVYHQISDDEQIAWSQAGLARALMGQGKWDTAHQLLTEALWTSIEIKGFIPMIFSLPFAVQYLAREDPEMASKVFQKMMSSPILANAPYFQDVVYRFLPERIKSIKIQRKDQPFRPNEDLWAASSSVLSSWTQVWMEEPENIEAKPKES